MIHRLPRDRSARTPDSDADTLRTAASAANDAVDAITMLPVKRMAHGLHVVVQRYGRALEIGVRELQQALQAARTALRSGQKVGSFAKQVDAATAPAALDLLAPRAPTAERR